MKLHIIELLSDKTNNLYYEIIENDEWRFPSHGIFRTKEEAENYINGYEEQALEAAGERV